MTDMLHELITKQSAYIVELQAELSLLRKGEAVVKEDNKHVQDEAKLTEVPVDWQAAYDDLKAQHEALRAMHAQCEERLERADRRYTKAKQRVLEWHAYVQKQIARKKLKSSGSEALPQSSDIAQPRLLSTPPAEDRTIIDELLSSTTPRAVSCVPEAEAAIETSSRNKTAQFGSSQSTIPEPDPPPADLKRRASDRDDDDTVEFVSATCKRRRGAKSTPVRIKTEPGTNDRPFLVLSDPVDENLPPSAITKKPPAKTVSKSAPQRTPLRQLPLNALKLDHFKPNPKFTGPYLRPLDSNVPRTPRRCPPECRRPECCGDKYRKLVESSGMKVSARTDEEVLNEYLGPNWSKVMASYEPERRKDVLIHAHTVSFASSTSARRKNLDRANTPPGFWRIDMATTQENEADVQHAEEMQADLVKECWQEANRHNGKWVFRDELP